VCVLAGDGGLLGNRRLRERPAWRWRLTSGRLGRVRRRGDGVLRGRCGLRGSVGRDHAGWSVRSGASGVRESACGRIRTSRTTPTRGCWRTWSGWDTYRGCGWRRGRSGSCVAWCVTGSSWSTNGEAPSCGSAALLRQHRVQRCEASRWSRPWRDLAAERCRTSVSRVDGSWIVTWPGSDQFNQEVRAVEERLKLVVRRSGGSTRLLALRVWVT
jgi:hypothetical protein